MREVKNSGVEWIGVIPSEWDTLKIKFIKSENKNSFVDGPFGSNLKSEHFVDDGDVFVIESNFATQGKMNEENLKTITHDHYDTISRSECKAGDIIIAKIGEYFGLSNILPKLSKPSVVSGNSLKLTVSEAHSTKYIWYTLLVNKYSGNLDLLVNGSGQPALSLGGLNEEKLPIPKFCKEELAIASYLDRKCAEIDKVIKAKESLIEKLKEYRQSVIYEAVTKGLDKNAEMKDSGIKWIGKIPEAWETRRLKYLAEICNGQDFKKVQVKEGGYPVMGSGGEFARASEYMYMQPSVLLGRKGTIDKPLYVDFPFWTVDTMYYTKIDKSTAAKYFYYLCLNINFDMYQYGSAVPSMTQRDLNEIFMPFPPTVFEQQQISDFLDSKCAEIDSVISANDSSIQKLKEYRKSVIYEAVTGKTDIISVNMS